ncbi:MAG TPA: LPS assembly lipoprotein LptE [Sphingomonas sp.]|jgi:LPS-assembly lipoprotein|nr:LPS assembly lipoprotein LptE [Sphingomonas sp.]
MKRLAALLLPLGLSGCGLHPLYAGGAHGPVARQLAEVEVGPISGQSGWLMRNALTDRIGAAGQATPRYRLEVELSDQLTGLGIRSDNTVTRERRRLRARFRLVTTDAAGTTVLDASAGSDTGIDVVSSDYATVAAEQTALENLVNDVADQIVARVAVYARRSQAH